MKKLLLLLLLSFSFVGSANAACACKGYSGVGGPCYDGVGGPMYSGVGGGAYAGVGGPAYDGVGGAAYSGVGGPAYAGVGGPCYDGVGGPCYDGVGGGWNCPAVCSLNFGNSSSYSNTNTNNSYFINNTNTNIGGANYYSPATGVGATQGFPQLGAAPAVAPQFNNNRYAPMTNSSYNQGYMEGAATYTYINLSSLFDSSSDKWKCPSGYKRDMEYGCVKGFVANFYDGADAYEKGDYKTAIKHWELLAEHGNADAQYNLGFMYENGIGLKKNDYWAFLWINKAAQLGQASAQFTLGNMYYTGAGIVKDYKQTVKWFKEAGKKGHASAQFNLGAMYIMGNAIDKSLKDAKYWIALANENGHERAEEIWDAFELWKY